MGYCRYLDPLLVNRCNRWQYSRHQVSSPPMGSDWTVHGCKLWAHGCRAVAVVQAHQQNNFSPHYYQAVLGHFIHVNFGPMVAEQMQPLQDWPSVPRNMVRFDL